MSAGGAGAAAAWPDAFIYGAGYPSLMAARIEPEPPSPRPGETPEPNIMATVAYVLSFITGIIVLAMGAGKDRFVKFHALQSIFLGLAWLVGSVGIGILSSLRFLGFLGWFQALWGLALLGISVVCAVQAFQGKWFKLPVVGDLAHANT